MENVEISTTILSCHGSLYELVLHFFEDEKMIEKSSVYLITTKSAGMVGICLDHKIFSSTKLRCKSNLGCAQ